MMSMAETMAEPDGARNAFCLSRLALPGILGCDNLREEKQQ